MNIIVLVKQVPNTTNIRLDPVTGNLIREGLESIMNPDDLHAIEAAVKIRKETKGKVTAVSMGPPQAVDVLTQAMGMGADKAVLLSDKAFSGADTWATSYTLSKGIEKIRDYDLIICGHQAIDGDTAQIGPQVADWLDIAQATCVSDIELADDNKSSDSKSSDNKSNDNKSSDSNSGDNKSGKNEIVVKRRLENGFERVACKMPALLTVISELNEPEYPHMGRLISACEQKASIKIWNAADIGVKTIEVGLEGSNTLVIKTFTPNFKRQNELLEGSNKEIVSDLIDRLKKSDTTIAHRF